MSIKIAKILSKQLIPKSLELELECPYCNSKNYYDDIYVGPFNEKQKCSYCDRVFKIKYEE